MIRTILCLAILFFLPLCGLSQTSPPLDTRFNIVLTQSSEPEGVLATLTTTATYPCEGYQLKTRVVRLDDTLTVYVNGLIRPTPCFQTSSNATGTVYLEGISRGVYFLRISYRGESDIYKLIVDDKSFGVISLRSDFTELRSDL